MINGVFRSEGGAIRLMIMEDLDGPKKRSEMAKLTDADWKEMDHNIRILESVGKGDSSHMEKHRVFFEILRNKGRI